MTVTLGMALLRPSPEAPGFELGFKVADVEGGYAERLVWDAPLVTALTDRPWGQRTTHAQDSDGRPMELAQAMAPGRSALGAV